MTSTTHSPHRSDAHLFAAVRHALDVNPAVPATVRIHVDAGTVVLTGNVRAPFERIEAAETVRRIEGVLGVVNDIVVVDVPNAGFEPPDPAGS